MVIGTTRANISISISISKKGEELGMRYIIY